MIKMSENYARAMRYEAEGRGGGEKENEGRTKHGKTTKRARVKERRMQEEVGNREWEERVGRGRRTESTESRRIIRHIYIRERGGVRERERDGWGG